MDFKFVHAADLHLDSPMRGIARRTELPRLFLEASFLALERLVTLCLDERADLLLLAGDLFDLADRSVRARLTLSRQLLRLDAGGVQTFIVHGNHDPLSPGAPPLDLPRSVTVFGSAWAEHAVMRGDARLCTVQGLSHSSSATPENLARGFRRTWPGSSLGLLHANVGGHPEHGNYAPCSLEDLDAVGLDYWALGHVHTRTQYALGSGGLAAYPGNFQGRHVREDGPRGCYVVTVRQGNVDLRFVPTDAVRWHRWTFDAAGVGSVEALQEAVLSQAEALEPGLAGHAVRVELTGRGKLHAELSSLEMREAIESELGQALLARDTPILLESLWVNTAPALALDSVRASGGLPALLLDLSEKPPPTTVPDDRARLEAILRRCGVESPFASEALWRAAGERVVELLVAEES